MSEVSRRSILTASAGLALSGCAYLPAQLRGKKAKPETGSEAVIERTDGAIVKIPGKIAYASRGNLMVIEDGIAKELTKSGKDSQPSWSPDGSVIAYVKREQSYSDILLFVVGTGDFRPVTNNRLSRSVWAFRPTWSPDGRQFAYTSDLSGWDLALYLMNVNGTAQRRLGQQDQGGVDSPTWSADGKQIAVAAFQGKVQQISIYTIATARWTQVTKLPDGAYDPKWSPVEERLAFVGRSERKHDLYVCNTDGANLQRITTHGTVRAPSWSPDGQWLAWVQEDAGVFGVAVAQVKRGPLGEVSLGPPTRVTPDAFPADPVSGLSWLYGAPPQS